jgi:uncharacterized protein YkwD/LysM repeat protein
MDKHRLALAALVSVLLLGYVGGYQRAVLASPSPARLSSPSELIQLVNGLRAANGLQPYRANSALMAAAQAHSEYQAASGNASHTGKGGSRPHDRAVAYGYGGGAGVSVSENIYSGSSASAAQAVGWWQGDSLHLGTMLSSSYRDVGAGLAEANGVNYYTLVVGYISGEEGQPPAAQPPSGQSGSDGSPSKPPGSAPAGTPAAWLIPIQAATPRADGSIIHEVQWGQFLYNIADAYKVELPYLLVLNGINANTVIYPGDKLLIRPAEPTPTPEASPTAATTQPPLATPAPAGANSDQPRASQTGTPTPTPQEIQEADSPVAATAAAGAAVLSPGDSSASGIRPADAPGAPDAGALAGSPATSQGGLDPILAVIGGLVVLGTALLLFGSFVNRRL